MGEGGGALLIETEEHALARGARIICRLAGYGNNTDGYHVTAPRPDGSGAVACMKSALEIAGMGPADIDYINAHGTSTPVGDPTRSEGHKVSLRRNGGLHTCRKLHKGQHRPSHGSGRITEIIACIKAIETGIIPPTLDYETPDPLCDLDFVPEGPRKASVEDCHVQCPGLWRTEFQHHSHKIRITYPHYKNERLASRTGSKGAHFIFITFLLHYAAGRRTVIFVPLSSALWRSIFPSICSTACFTMESPSPVPLTLEEWLLSALKNLSNTLSLYSAGMPIPVSSTVITASPFPFSRKHSRFRFPCYTLWRFHTGCR